MFRSTAYQWLVVAGARAQYKGVGTVNGSGAYDFLLTAIDGALPGGGGQDAFRIRVSSSDGVLYDNRRGDDPQASSAQAIDSGSIVIHK